MSLRASPGIAAFISPNSCFRHYTVSCTRSFTSYTRFGCLPRVCSHHRINRDRAIVTPNFSSQKRAFHASAPSAAPKDPYQVLGVAKDATPSEIKKVYFSLARKYHPDTNPDKSAREKFVEIQEAYDILKDEKKRKAYDQYGAASQQPGFDPDAWSHNAFGSSAGGFGGGFQSFSFGGSGGGSPDEIFEQLFGAFSGAGGGRSRSSGFSQNLRGEDLEASIGVSFMEACKGTTRTVNVMPVENCSSCAGTGLKPGAKRSTCSTCGGTGTRTFVIDNGFQMASTCSSCQGTGTTVPRGNQCGDCRGMGKVRMRRSVKVDVPAGIEDGMTIRIPNAGDVVRAGKGPTGDLLVRVNVAASKTFRRKGANLYHEARIPLHTALLGGRVRVPTLDGEVDVRVPGGTQQGEEMMLKGRGVNRIIGSGADKGDLFVTFSVQLPRLLTQRQREILQQYADDVEGRRTTNVKAQPNTTDEPYSSGSRLSDPPRNNDDINESPSPSEQEKEEDEEGEGRRMAAG